MSPHENDEQNKGQESSGERHDCAGYHADQQRHGEQKRGCEPEVRQPIQRRRFCLELQAEFVDAGGIVIRW